ncbi:MAG TPA: ABC transporter substrate-binding protein [Ferruginibacter sp.]|jgi:hypothetical protein|nr:ABC transporter substrate-binding protein [Bacteroidota bacterium]MCC6693409.1 ABC transporter substrate-binding protein [Chitinophagaceae bacterium]HMT97264.1 ABC transporter substrate-binding protein [Ferruginibacter sp.]HMU24579.1 ABC transporter substrate-binding protein [Ferruginibacter sp.]
MNSKLPLLLLLGLCIGIMKVQAQVTPNKPDSFILRGDPPVPVFPAYKVAVFSPLYLDSAFLGESYRYNKTFPRFTLQGFEFVQGVQLALDSMKLYGGNITTEIFDSKSYSLPIPTLISQGKLDSFNLIIGNVKDAEYLQLADFAREKNIPFVSATYPNDGGVSSNPFVAILNPTLKAHCEAIYSYILQNHGASNVVLVRKSGVQEDRVASYIKAINRQDGKDLIKIKTLYLDSAIQLRNYLDSGKRTILLCGSLNESFASKVLQAAAGYNARYPSMLFGMPNWESFSFFKKTTAVSSYPVYITTPYINDRKDDKSKWINDYYLAKFQGIPSDLVFKGYETAFNFIQLLARHPVDFMSHIEDNAYEVFTDFTIKPVYLNAASVHPDYFENKKLYFMKLWNSTAARAW